ncbi:MAG TPA: response regulator [Burkholderiales bacterium]|jgi:CheY-like chemotaxis protein|nr:response regulator [Burkholderiales bacterium]
MNWLPRILLVEDSAQDAEMTLRAFEACHLANEVLHLHDGAEALDFLHRRGKFAGRTNGQPALVLLDLKMPKMDGLEVLRQMREDADLRLIPVVIMTSSRAERDLLDSYRLGVNAYVVKPVKFSDFIGAVRQVGAFWAVLNEPPPGSVPRRAPPETR